MKRNSTIVKDINQMFSPSNPDYPICFERDNRIIVSGESVTSEGITAIDYYGEFQGNYPWVHKGLTDYLEENGFHYEWENAACIIIYKEG